MAHSLALDSQQLALELHTLLRDIDPARWKDDLEEAARERILELQKRMQVMLDTTSDEQAIATLKLHLQRLSDLLAKVPRPNIPTAQLKQEWMSYRKQLMEAYETVCADLRGYSIHVPSLRPTNYSRNFFHVGNGLGVALTVYYLMTPTIMKVVATSFLVLVWCLEYFRRDNGALNDLLMKMLGRFAHPHETHRVNSATWYTTALALLAWTCPPMVCLIAVVVLAFGDPAAAVIGRRFGKTKLVNGRSLEGTLAFVGFGVLAAFGMMTLWYGTLPLTHRLLIAFTAVLPAALAELFSRRIDDNLSIPLSAAAGAQLALLVFLA